MRRLQLVCSEVCCPMPTESIGRNRYFVTFVDDCLRCCPVYFLKRGTEFPDKFKLFERHATNDLKTSWTYVRRDVVLNEQGFGHGSEKVSRRSPPETVEIQPSSDDIFK